MPGEKILKRLDLVEKILLARINRYRRLVKDGSQDEPEEHRIWIEEMIKRYVPNGRGLDICCGDFPICVGEIEGVDTAADVLGLYWRVSGDELTFCEPNTLDYLVTNYLESFPNTVKALNEWHRVLKDTGVLVLVMQNADSYSVTSVGPLGNKKKMHCFTPTTVLFYLHRCGFVVETRELIGDVIRLVAKKGEV